MHGCHGAQEKDMQDPNLTYLPAAIPVSQKTKHYAEDHVAEKHHLRRIETQLWRAHSQQHQAAPFFELWAS